MINNFSIDVTQMLNIGSDVRISASSSFNAQDAYENTFEDLIQEETIKFEEEKKENKINFEALGMPPGFILDTSLLESFES